MLARLARAGLVIPDVQLHQLDLDYVYYAFALFHQSAMNRALHAIGLPLAVAGLYLTCRPWPWLAATVPILLLGYHLTLAARYRLGGIVPLLLGAHGGFWLVVEGVLHPWPVPALPLLLVGSTLAYLGHAAEPYVPPPFVPTRAFVPRAEWIARARRRHRALVVLCAPMHVVVEAISAPRNLFVLLLVAGRCAGRCAEEIDALQGRAMRVAVAAEPPLTRRDFRNAVAHLEART